MRLTASVTVKHNRTSGKIRGVKAGTEAAVQRASAVILAEAERRVKRGKTGEIAASLAIKERYGDADTVAVGSFGLKRPIARFLDLGTVKTHAQPFLRPAAALGRKTLKLEAEAEVRKAAEES